MHTKLFCIHVVLKLAQPEVLRQSWTRGQPQCQGAVSLSQQMAVTVINYAFIILYISSQNMISTIIYDKMYYVQYPKHRKQIYSTTYTRCGGRRYRTGSNRFFITSHDYEIPEGNADSWFAEGKRYDDALNATIHQKRVRQTYLMMEIARIKALANWSSTNIFFPWLKLAVEVDQTLTIRDLANVDGMVLH